MNINRDELIERYLDGTASEGELATLKEQMAVDSQLQKEVAMQRLMKGVLKADKQRAFEKELSQLSESILRPKMQSTKNDQNKEQEQTKDHQQKKAKVKSLFSQRIALAIAASIALILVAVFIFQDQPDGQALYASHYQPFSVKNIRGENSERLKVKIAEAYNLGNYEATKPYIIAYLQEGPDSADRYELILANCHLNLNETTQAIQLLTKVVKQEDINYRQDAQWYLALAHLKADDLSNAQQVLQLILQNENHLYYNKAKKLLAEL